MLKQKRTREDIFPIDTSVDQSFRSFIRVYIGELANNGLVESWSSDKDIFTFIFITHYSRNNRFHLETPRIEPEEYMLVDESRLFNILLNNPL